MVDFDAVSRNAALFNGPRHTVSRVAERTGASIHQPSAVSVKLRDKLLSKFYGQPEHWSLARRFVKQSAGNEVVFCLGQDVGIPLAVISVIASKPLKIAMSTMSPERLGFKLLMKLLGLNRKITLFIVNDKQKECFLESVLSVDRGNILKLPEQTDELFFIPAQEPVHNDVPIIASAGLEQRDYDTLAKATKDLPVKVKICAFSPNITKKQKVSMPEVQPENMEIRHFSFSELRGLYQHASVVVVSLLENNYSAGLTVLMEAMACNRPVIITKNEGLANDLSDKGVVIGTKPSDVEGLKNAISMLLNNQKFADDLAKKGHEYFLQHHTSEHYVELLSQKLLSM
ncbi:MAG: glycosyltransferase [Marinagarivorans sp.]|nr:glycosyltransferase [Marinagarivorans sp.]